MEEVVGSIPTRSTNPFNGLPTLDSSRYSASRGSRSPTKQVESIILRLPVLPFLVPCHLDGFEFSFVRALWVIVKNRQFDHVAVQVGKAHFERVLCGKLVGECDGKVFSVIPCQLRV